MDDSDLEWLRTQRRQEFLRQRKAFELWKQMGHGEILESGGEVEFFSLSKSNPKVLVHFYKKDLNVERSQYLTKKMQALASKYIDILFVAADVERHPFLVSRLNIVVIPTVRITASWRSLLPFLTDRAAQIVFIKEMRITHGMTGFAELNNSDDWTEADLEALMTQHGMFEEYAPDWKENFAADNDVGHEFFS
ncbi:putative phosducin (Phd)-like family, thioredoxin (TRX) domain protein [Gregarina niphandrodes]|uniref:Phosducin (Phd)-like family, thioredoxin (TRX) domain protein n=1 Tax=Gregarina niphandrodes TaxID=110365 RepID=A0A023B9P5_GRENI|nr:putative phosducin (Phd)-like family, thioredoxin (TRX) domain protein [Gregarina niphandrodes]EZG73994.1 putative phosducin (Phd)-like family, thioredoxin (TRX) domain protein [Gregarina niphandrodes]|eukprot:XP_011129636.1 putative phosducin (Phd)-like family, thioredoxin (TRX) domain protein [Gregarina niphandrodes]